MDAARANDRRSLELLVAAGAVVGVVVFVVVVLVSGSLLVAAVVAVVMGVVAGVGLGVAAAPIVRGAVAARPLGDPPARLHNLLDGLAAGAGVDLPALATTTVTGAHALVVGERGGASTLVITPPLVDDLDRVELESVLARQLALVRDHSARLHTVAAVTVGLPALAADLAAAPHAALGAARVVAVAGVVLRPLAGPSRRAVRRLQGDDGPFEADRAATSLTPLPARPGRRPHQAGPQPGPTARRPRPGVVRRSPAPATAPTTGASRTGSKRSASCSAPNPGPDPRRRARGGRLLGW